MTASAMSLTRHLTVPQRQAVEHFDGPLLILAGPGSGKTRVVTHRIARMCERGVDPRNILAITFTNKAANEMVERVKRLLPGERVWISTFHRFCARLLRSRANAVGLEANFTILDAGDQRQLVKQILHDLNFDTVAFPPRRIAARISNEKNDLHTAEDVSRGFRDAVGNHLEAVVARVYPEYQKRLLQSNAVDFDDLLLHVVTLLSESAAIREQLGERYRYLLVDEYQDTNRAQYQIVTALSEGHRNLCVTGDPDQSIYGWRGARIANILRFEADFPEATVVRLEQNFRSTKQILKTADNLIAHNTQRKAKALLTDNDDGEPVECVRFLNALHEADDIAAEIREAVELGERSWADFAVCYRVNALSRELERALARHQAPFQVAAGVAFYDRAEIKDVLGYLRLIFNPDDEAAFRRVVNTPKRGIGKATLDKLSKWAQQQQMSLFEAAARCGECETLSKRSVAALSQFVKLIGGLSLDPTGAVTDLLEELLERTGYTDDWKGSAAEQDQQRLANVEELLTAAQHFDNREDEEPTLEGFLEETSLVNDVDSLDEDAGRVTLMTLHAAKGLEFPVVYIVGVEQNLIPHERALRDGDYRETEEERRLLFVGITRAKERLMLTHTLRRDFRGQSLPSIPSEFLGEISATMIDRSDDDDVWDRLSELKRSDGPSAERQPPRNPDRAKRRSATLVTGSDLLNGSDETAELPCGFAVGMTVRHPQYGGGRVVEIGGFSKRRTVTVLFDDDRRQTWVADKCPLQPVGMR